MQTKRDGDTDVVASFSAFKVVAHGFGNERRWQVNPLTKWAQGMLQGRDTKRLIAIHKGSTYTANPTLSVSFPRKNAALDFLRDLEEEKGGWGA